jgi:ParB/RepB/Spo0J family partition protein
MTTIYDFLRPLTSEEYDGLKASIKSTGQMFPIIHDQDGVIIDGHHRTRACAELGLKPLVEVRSYPTPEARLEAVIAANLHRRQSTHDDRKRLAEHLYTAHGMTMDAIARILGVSQQTISNDLETLPIAGKVSPRVDKHGRVNTGRPKAAPKPPKIPKSASDTAQAWAAKVIAGEISQEEAANQAGVSRTTMRTTVSHLKGQMEAHADPVIDASTLSMSAQDKLAAALRQHKKVLDATYADRVTEGIRKHMDETLLPILEKEKEEAEAIVASYKGVMSKGDYFLIVKCLHEDTWQSVDQPTRDKAFHIMDRHKNILVAAPKPPGGVPLPKTLSDLIKHRMSRDIAKRKKSSPAGGGEVMGA